MIERVSMAVKLVLRNESGGQWAGAWMMARLRRVLAELGIKRGEWTVLGVGDAEMTALHGRTMGVFETTDVLTFDLRDEGETKDKKRKTKDAKEALELDTVMCMDEARRRAREMGHRVREELLLYAIHSLLHVRGYDDVTAAGAAAMHRREDEILLGLGVGAVYAGKGNAGVSRAAGRTRPRAGNRKRAT